MIGPDKKDGTVARVLTAISRHELQDRVSLEGPVDKRDVPKAISQGDIFLNSSVVDNAPVTLIEPLACGLCVVSTDAGGIPDLVTHDHDALLVPVKDAAAMADQIVRILQEPGLSARLSRNGRETARAFDWPAVVGRWEELLVRAADGG
jgi:glycosyltransferase involved in cell wall biosynthesis